MLTHKERIEAIIAEKKAEIVEIKKRHRLVMDTANRAVAEAERAVRDRLISWIDQEATVAQIVQLQMLVRKLLSADSEEPKKAAITLRMPRYLAERIAALAAAEGISQNEYLNLVFEQMDKDEKDR